MDANTGVAANAYTDCLHTMDASSGLAANSYTLLPSHTQCITVSLTNTTTLINHQHAMHGSQSALAATMYMEANQHWLPL